MRRLTILALAALAVAQGRQTTEAFYANGTVGPGYVQADFLDCLEERLGDEFGARRAESMLDHIRGSRLDGKGVLALLNGDLDDAEIRSIFGLAHERPQFVRKALDAAVADKDKKLLFGALVRTMVEKGVDPSSEFCQIGDCRDELTAQQFDRLCRSEVSGSLMGECFGLKSKKDQSEMQGYMNATRASPYLLHPVGNSLAKRANLKGDFDPRKFPKARDDMPGYGNEYKDGLGGGLPFDRNLPPVPYYGKSLEDFYKAK